MSILKERLPVRFITFAALCLVAIFAVENINHRFWLNDFKVYYEGAKAFIHGDPVYGTLFALGSGYYKYSPFTLLLVLPFLIFPFNLACIIQYFILSVSIISLFLVSWHVINKYLFNSRTRNADLIISVAFVCVINHLVRELHLGNINVILLLLLCVSLLFMMQKRFVLAGILLALVIITKPFFVLLLLPLLLRKNVKVILATGISLLTFIISPAVFIGFSKNIQLHQEWISTVLDHNSSFPSNNTIENLVKLYIHPHPPAAIQFYLMIAVCIGYFIFFFINRSIERRHNHDEKLKSADLVIEWFTLIAIMPGLFKTDTQHFLLSLPLLLILLCYLSALKNHLLTVCFIGLILLYGGNSSDLVGKTFSIRMDESGVLGISNMLILFWVIFIYFRSVRKQVQVTT